MLIGFWNALARQPCVTAVPTEPPPRYFRPHNRTPARRLPPASSFIESNT